MNKTILFTTLPFLLFCHAVFAQNVNSLPLHQYIEKKTQTVWFSNSLSSGDHGFDSWTISSGYYYSLMKNINIYVATEMSTETTFSLGSKGLLSGIEYNFNERITFDSSVQTERTNEETIDSLGMSSKIKLSDQFNLEAKLGFNLNQSFSSSASYQVGVGYQF